MHRSLAFVALLAVAFAAPSFGQTTITSLSPASALVGGASFTLNVFGTGFGPLMPIQWDGATQATTFVSSTQLSCTITAAMISTVGPHNVRVRITVFPPSFTNTVVFNVNNPAPTVTSMSPTSINAGGAGVLLIIGGTGFNAATTVTADGVPLSISSATATNLNASVPASMVTVGDTLTISVSNPAPGGGTAAPQTLTVNNPVPTLSFPSPGSAAVGAGAVPITVLGTNYNTASVIRLDGADLATTFIGTGALSATIPAGTTAVGGAHTITVHNPAPGGGTTPPTTFNVNNPAPTLTSISPTTVFVGDPDTTVTFVGTNFNTQSVARRNGVNLATTLISSTQLTAVVPAVNLATFNTATLVVVNPAPGGGGTAAFNFSAINHAVPAITTLTPSTLLVQSSPANVTVAGTGFDPFTVVRFNGADCPTTFVSAASVTATFSAAQLSVASIASITAFNPTPGGGASGAVNFTVANPAPTLSSLAPNSVFGGMIETIVINGSGFVAASVARVNGVPVPTNFFNASAISAVIQGSMLSAIGSVSIDVTTPGPGGGTSSSLPLTIAGQPVPTITSLSPVSTHALLGNFNVAINGTGFTPLSTVTFQGLPFTKNFISSTFMTVTLTSSVTSTPGVGTIVVTNPAPGGGSSNGATFTFTTPAPALTGALPSTVTATLGAPPFSVVLSGSGFHFLSEAFLAGNPATSLPSIAGVGGTLIVTLQGSMRASPGTLEIYVANPSPGGGVSSSVSVTVTAPQPVLTQVSPSVVAGGLPSVNMTITGTGFLAESTVTVDGAELPKTGVTSTTISVTVPASLLSYAGTRRIRITNPGPGGGLFTEGVFAVSGPHLFAAVPAVIPVLSPGSPPMTILLSGLFPQPASTVRANGVSLPSTWLSSSLMTCVVDASLAATLQPGGFGLTVVQQSAGVGPVVSEAFGVTVGVAGSPDNAGTVTVVPRPALPGEEFFLRVEAPVFGQPLSLIADFAQTSLVPLVFDPAFDVVSGVLFGAPFPLADGLGLLGPPTPSTLRADDASTFNVPNPRGVFDLRGLVAPPVPFGVSFQLQAIYLDPALPFGFNVTHVNPQTL